MSNSFNFIAPVPDLQINARSGNNYIADASGIITGVVPGDFLDLAQAGCKIGGNLTERIPLLNARNTTGAALGATATGGAMGYSITLGTSEALVGEATSSNAKTDVCLFEYILPSSYVAGTTVNLIVNTNYTGSGTVTAASTTITPTVYLNADAGTQGANLSTTTTSSQITGTATDYTFPISGATLTAGARLSIELSLLCTTSAGL